MIKIYKIIITVTFGLTLIYPSKNIYKQVRKNQSLINDVYRHLVTNYVDDSPTGSLTILSIPLTIIFLLLAVSSIVISLRVKKRRYEL